MPATYDKIATTTLGSANASVTFSSISGSYTDLVLIINALASSLNPAIKCQFNSDTGTNYSATRLTGNGSTAASARGSNLNQIYVSWAGGPTTTFEFNNITHIQNYSNTTTYKTTLSRANTPSAVTEAIVGLWRSTSAITSIKLEASESTFASGSTFTLYGILKA